VDSVQGSCYRRILTYLIPLRLLRGHLPSRELMERFPDLDGLFAPFTGALRKGDIAAFDKALEKRERRLAELNLWLVLEKASELCIRGLFRRVCVVLVSLPRIARRSTFSSFSFTLSVDG
jgi:hypothetical protein